MLLCYFKVSFDYYYKIISQKLVRNKGLIPL